MRPLLLAAVLLLACSSDPGSPGPTMGRYTLRQLNGSPLPYDHGGLGCCIYRSGELGLLGGEYEAAITAENRNNGLVFTVREWGTYVPRLGSRIAFATDSFAIQPLILDTARVAADTIRVGFGGEGPGSPDQFQALFVREP
jgi:hypothetical protein